MGNLSFAFIDESGTLANDPHQPYFALGMLILPDTAVLYQKLELIRNQFIAAVRPPRPYEFKSSLITISSIPFYIRLVDAVLDEPGARVCIFFLDKTGISIDPLRYFPSTWDAYLRYSEILLKNNIKHMPSKHYFVVLADYLSKPGNHTELFETRIRRLPFVPNAVMLESHASLFIQAIDVFTGAVMNHFRRDRMNPPRHSASKRALADHIAGRLGVQTLADSITKSGLPSYFSVWEFEP